MKKLYVILAILFTSVLLNFVLAVFVARFQPLRIHEDGPTAAQASMKAELVRQHPAVTASEVDVRAIEATTGFSRRVVIAVGFDETHYVAGPKTDDEWVSFQYGPFSAGSRSVEYSGINEPRRYIPIIHIRTFSGWPFPALSRNLVSDQDPEVAANMFIHSNAVPCVPVFPGFVLNTLIYAALLLGIYLFYCCLSTGRAAPR